MVFEDNKEYGQCQKPYTAQHLLSLLHVHADAKYYQGTVDYQRMDLLRIRSILRCTELSPYSGLCYRSTRFKS